MRSLASLLVLLLAVLSAGCGLLPEQVDETAGWSANKLYAEAKTAMGDGAYDKAVKYFEKLEARYPYGRYAQQAQLEVAYAYFKQMEPASAIAACDRFIRLHPNHPNVDYAYYMKGLAAYSSNEDLLDRFLPTDPSKRDTDHAREAFAEFSQLVARFPDSPYAADAKARMVSLRNLLAQHEINVANYYLKRGAYLAAVNRGRFVVENFQRTPAVADGLAIMAQGYLLLGMDDLAWTIIILLLFLMIIFVPSLLNHQYIYEISFLVRLHVDAFCNL